MQPLLLAENEQQNALSVRGAILHAARNSTTGGSMAREKKGGKMKLEGAWLTMAEAECSLGVGSGGLHASLIKHPSLWRTTRRKGKYRYIPIGTLEKYEKITERLNTPRAHERPKGWPGLYRAASIVGIGRTAIRNAVTRGELRAVRVGCINYYCPDGVERLRLKYKDTPLPGWIQTRVFAQQHGASSHAAWRWLRRNNRETRKYRRGNRLVCYALERDLKAWAAQYEQYERRAR